LPAVDRQWGAEQLEDFVSAIDDLEKLYDAQNRTGSDLRADIKELDKKLRTLEPAVQIVMDAFDPALRNYTSPDEAKEGRSRVRWWPAKNAALKTLGLLTTGAEAKRRMRADAPELAADRLHPWVWDAARPMWEAGSPPAAVFAAAQSVNARLQQTLGRCDVSEVELCREAFTLNDPKPGQSRLRFPGDRSTDTWKALQNGARDFGVGCFTAIRHPLAHNHQYPLQMQEALEQLAAFSVLARWIESCTPDPPLPA
jgi:Protein of unknown function (Hypoth_ymh)